MWSRSSLIKGSFIIFLIKITEIIWYSANAKPKEDIIKVGPVMAIHNEIFACHMSEETRIICYVADLAMHSIAKQHKDVKTYAYETIATIST